MKLNKENARAFNSSLKNAVKELSSFNPTECIKCGKMIDNLLDYIPNKKQ